MAHRICERCGSRMNPQMIRKVFRYNKEDIGVDCEGFVCEECGGIVFASDEFRRIDGYIRAAYPLKEVNDGI